MTTTADLEWLEANGLQIAFRRQGSGPPLVLLHGGLSDSRVWRPQVEALADEFTVIAWDAPGCGESDDPPDWFSLADYADTLAGLAQGLSLEKPHILGLSFGGGLALEFFNRHPHIPKTLTLASAYAGWAGSLPPEEVEERLERGVEQSEQPPKQVAQAWQSSFFSQTAAPEAIAENTAIMAEFHPAGMRVMLSAFAEADLRPVLPEIDVPVLLLYGDEDVRSPLLIAHELHETIPDSELVIMPGVGHLSNLEAPQRFNDHVRRFLRTHRN